MKPKTFPLLILAFFTLLVGAVAVRAADETTTLVWNPNDPADKVIEYVVQYRPRPSPTNSSAWSVVIVPASPSPTVVLPVPPFGTEFRLAATNKFSLYPWTETFFLPAAVRGLKLVLPLAP